MISFNKTSRLLNKIYVEFPLYALTLAQELSDVFDKLNDIGVRFGPISILSNEISHEALEILFPTIQIAPVHYYVLTPLSIQKTKTHLDFEQWLSQQKS